MNPAVHQQECIEICVCGYFYPPPCQYFKPKQACSTQFTRQRNIEVFATSYLKKKYVPPVGSTSHLTSVQMHCRYVHGKPVQDRCETRVRPQRLAAKRANEFLCIVHRYETSSEDADWLEKTKLIQVV
ncbi:hypothetical protein EVAR_17348_1 [Eumeta japonica]|uniref:Uncharacterized protein n=1 Tax=Eumeta variegata TaxID=151549 RepID=A0A4C1WIW3_EUMVA|nr:hypothetical protein EVAR_17348_1 [Eumeta japonica]